MQQNFKSGFLASKQYSVYFNQCNLYAAVMDYHRILRNLERDISFPVVFRIKTETSKVEPKLQWLSGKVLNSSSRGCGFEPIRKHCVVSLRKTHYLLLSTSSTLEEPS